MKVIKGLLIAILASILFLCGLIMLNLFKPDLFAGISKSNDESAAVAEEPEPPSSDTQDKIKISYNSVSENEPPDTGDLSIDGSYFADDVADSGLRGGLDASYDTDSPDFEINEELKNQTGLEEPRGRYDILDDDKADSIESQLSTGPIGDDLSFDEEFYPYYHMLDNRGQHLYRQIYANAMELNADFKAVEKSMPWSSFRNVFEAVFNDHPELFWLNTEFSAGYRDNGECLEVILSFNRTAQDIDNSAAQFDAGANAIGSAAYGNEYEQERAVHDAILDAFSYSLSAEMNQSAYSGFVNNQTVCAGYARSFQYVMQQLGIPCYYCRGVAGEPHAWNIIKLGGDYYNVDATWDDSSSTWQYEYFNLSDSELNKDHRRTSLSVYLPACGGGEYSHLESEPERNEGGGDLPEGTYTSSREEYFDLCTQAIRDFGKGTYSFDIYTTDKEVYESCRRAYTDGTAEREYMGDALEAVDGAKGLTVEMVGSGEDGIYRMTHNVRMW